MVKTGISCQDIIQAKSLVGFEKGLDISIAIENIHGYIS